MYVYVTIMIETCELLTRILLQRHFMELGPLIELNAVNCRLGGGGGGIILILWTARIVKQFLLKKYHFSSNYKTVSSQKVP